MIEISDEKQYTNRHKILIVASLHGKHVSCILNRQSTEVVTEAIIKPNVLNNDIVKTAIINGKHLSKHNASGRVNYIW